MIREREIRNFTETPFYRVVGDFLPEGAENEVSVAAEWKAVEGSGYFESPLLYKENGFKKRESAEKLIGELDGKMAFVKSMERGTSRRKHHCYLILQSCRQSAPNDTRSVRMRHCRWHRIYMRENSRLIQEQMREFCQQR